MVPRVRAAFEQGEVQFSDMFEQGPNLTFESNVPFLLRFMIDTGVLSPPRLPVLLRFDVGLDCRDELG